MQIDVVIPTCKKMTEVSNQVATIKNLYPFNRVIGTYLNESAARNRNRAHQFALTPIVIMLDDDIEGFYPNWIEDLIKPLQEDYSIRLVSARLMREDGRSPNHMMASKFQMNIKLEDVPRTPTSCFAYRKGDLDTLIGFHNTLSKPFDEGFQGSGWEDDALCADLKKKFSDCRIVINNECKLIHRNEMKGDQQRLLSVNKDYFFKSGRTR